MALPQPTVQRIGIIGAGVSGIASAKALLAEKCFQTIEILERRGETGGLWNYTPEVATAPVPSTDPNFVEEPVINGKKTIFISAVYDKLESNFPKKLMGFDGFPFPDDLPLFPSHEEVREYIQQYGREIHHLITFNAMVIDCRKQGNQWEMLFKDTQTGSIEKRVYDAVIVAVGHYDVPYIPPVPGLKEWHAEYQGSISHSKYFRSPEVYTGKKVIIVGNAASGVDIAAQVCQFSQRPLLQSQRKKSSFLTETNPAEICEASEITAFSTLDKSVHFSDGRIERDVDSVIFCTGYLYSLPFLSTLNTGLDALITDGTRVNHVYQHIFYIPDQTLSFVGLPKKVPPFVIGQATAALIARVLANRVTLPSPAEMKNWENQMIEERGSGGQFHTFGFPKDADYLDLIRSICENAVGEEDGTLGLKPPVRGDEERWMSVRLTQIREAYMDMKKRGAVVKRQEELGFGFKLGESRFGTLEMES